MQVIKAEFERIVPKEGEETQYYDMEMKYTDKTGSPHTLMCRISKDKMDRINGLFSQFVN